MSTAPTLSLIFPHLPTGVLSVTNVAELRRVLSNTILHGDNLMVDGLNTLGDGSGGMFVYDATSTLADDGTATVRPIDLGDNEPGRWRSVDHHAAILAPPDASTVTYTSAYPSVRDALDALLYVAPTITNFTASPSMVETGSTVASVTLTWALNKTVTTQTIPGLTLTPAARTATVAGPFTSDQTWGLTADDGHSTVSATAALTFRQKRYWGMATSPTLTNDQLLGLSGEFSTSKAKTITYDCTGGGYPYFAYPATLGDPAGVTVGGLAFSDLVVSTVSLTNASGYVADYRVVRFGHVQTGAAIRVAWG